MSLSLRLLLVWLCLSSAGVLAQPIYRVVDEQGNVTYTDQKPSGESEPMQLPDISVISITDPAVEELIEGEDGAGRAIEPFRMTMAEPADGSVIANAEGRIDVRMESNLDVPPAAQLVVFLNDQPQPPVRDLTLSLNNLPPNQYEIRAELQSPSGRMLAETEPVTVRLIATDTP